VTHYSLGWLPRWARAASKAPRLANAMLGGPLPETPIREAWLGQLFFSYQSNNATVIQILESYIGEAQQHLAALEALQAMFPSSEARAHLAREFQFHLLTLDYGLDVHRFQIGWLKKAIQQIQGYGD
jgi:hypothetical protein